MQGEAGTFVARYGVTHEWWREARSIPPGMFAKKDEDKVF